MNVFYTVLIVAALTVIELLIGGTRLLFSLPAYLLLAAAAVGSVRDLRRPKLSPNGLCLATTGVFMAYILARAFASPVPYLAWPDEFMVAGALIVYLLFACYLTDPRRRYWTLGALLILAFVNLVVGARQFSEGSGHMLFGFRRSEQYLGRASGLYICPDHLAGYLEVLTCLCLSTAIWSRLRAWIKLLFGYGAVCCVGGVLITASRGGVLSLAAGLGVLLVLGLWRVRATQPGTLLRVVLMLLVVLGVLGAGGAVAVSRSHLISGRIQAVMDTQDIRLKLWPPAIEQFRQEPVWGTGSGTYLYYGRKFRNPAVQSDPVRPHNDYLELLAEYGAVGAGLFLCFLAAHLRWGWRAFRHFSLRLDSAGGSNAAAWNLGALASVACIAAHSVVDFNLHIPANTLLMALVFGVLASPGRAIGDMADQVARFRLADLWARLALPALGVWIAVAGVPRLPGEFYAEKARVALRDEHNLAALGFAVQGLERERQNPLLYGYLGAARLNLAGNGPDSPVARSFREAAADAYRDAVRLSPQDSLLLARLSEAYTRLGDFPAAEDAIRRALDWDPHSGFVQTYHGFYLQNRGQLPEAEGAYRQALGLSPYPAADKGLHEVLAARAASEAAVNPK